MAYRSAARRGRSTSRAPVRRRSTSSYSSRRRAPQRRGRTVRRASAGRTVRIVIEQPPANAIQRPAGIGLMEAAPPRKSQF